MSLSILRRNNKTKHLHRAVNVNFYNVSIQARWEITRETSESLYSYEQVATV